MAVPHATDVRRHWYWRPGWGVGSRFYTWHITFDGQPEVVKRAEEYGAVLSRQPMLDVIPTQWLHLTMQGIGFVDNVDREQVDAIVTAAQTRCVALASMELAIGAPHVDPESIQIAVEPAASVRQLRAAIRAAIADGPAAPLVEARTAVPAVTATAVIDSCQLIVLNRDEGMYVWEPYATVSFGR